VSPWLGFLLFWLSCVAVYGLARLLMLALAGVVWLWEKAGSLRGSR